MAYLAYLSTFHGVVEDEVRKVAQGLVVKNHNFLMKNVEVP